jgi:hypothetical protein
MRQGSRLVLVGAIAGLLALLSTVMTPVSAAEIDVSFVVTEGTITIGPRDFELPADGTTGIVGVWDDATGDFAGEYIVPPRRTTQRNETVIPGDIELEINMLFDPVVGTVDPVSGEIDVETEVDVVLTFIQLVPDADPTSPVPLNVECVLGPIELQLSSSPDGEPIDFAESPLSFVVTDDEFDVGDPACGPGSVPGFPEPDATIINLVRTGLIENLETPTTGSTRVAFEEGEIQEADPLSDPVTPPEPVQPAPVTPAAAPVQQAPRVTG